MKKREVGRGLVFVAITLCIWLFNSVLAQTGSFKDTGSWPGKTQKRIYKVARKVPREELMSIASRLQQLTELKQSITPDVVWSSELRETLENRARDSLDLLTSVRKTSRIGSCNFYKNERNGTPVFMTGMGLRKQTPKLSATSSASRVALIYFEQNKDIFRLDDPFDELSVIQEKVDKLGKTHVKFQQRYKGIPVWGHDLVVHLDTNGELYAINARYSPTPKEIDFDAHRIAASEAIGIAKRCLATRLEIQELSESIKEILKYEGPEANLYIWVDRETQKPHLVWHVEICPNPRDLWYYFIDANDGEILEKYNATNFDGPVIASATDLNGINQTINAYQVGTTYYMIDASRPIWQAVQPDIVNNPKGALWTIDALYTDLENLDNVTSTDNTWSDPVSVSAHFNAGQVFEYYYTTFGRDAIDDSGSTIISVIHVTDDGQSYGGAFWQPGLRFIGYGDGNSCVKPLAGALDVAAHEMTHGVVQYTVDLKYEFQSGALNESFADVFGAMVDREDWLIGEDIVKLICYPSGALRNMADPHNGGNPSDYYWQPSHMNEFVELTIEQDHGGVHTNSGIPNHAAYLIGSTIGKDKLEQIYYRILDALHLNSQAQFIDMRLAAILAAGELYGEQSAEVASVKTAFDAVGIFDDTGTEQPPDVPPVEGEEWVAVVNDEPTDNSLYLVSPDLQQPEIKQLTTTQVFTGTACPISVSRDGSAIVFVDSANFIRAIASDGSGETVISAEGVWWSVALSPDGNKLAATSIYVDSTMYIFNLVDPNSSKAVHLYSPTTGDVTADVTLYADALDWNLTSEYVLYDAFNSIPQAGGGAIEYWDINILYVDNEIIFPTFPPQPEGIHMGNPSFASTNDIFFVFDYINNNTGSDYIMAVNLFTMDVGLIEDNGSSIGFPDYSPDDSRIVFQREESGSKTLRQIAVDTTKITPIEPSQSWVIDGRLPTWFVIGSEVDVEEPYTPRGLPDAFCLSQNYPNPFNPSTVIEYSIPRRSQVEITLYNLLGQKVKTLVDKVEPAGNYSAYWNGTDYSGKPVASGVYLYRLKAGDFVETRKMILLK